MNSLAKSILFMALFNGLLLAGDTTPLDTSCQTGQGPQYCHRERSAAIYEIASSLDILGTRNDKEEPGEGDSIIINSCGADPIRKEISNGGKDSWFSSDKFMHLGVSAATP